MHDAAREVQAALHAAAEAADGFFGPVEQADQLQDLAHPALEVPTLHPVGRSPVAEVVDRVQFLVQGQLLRHDTEPAPRSRTFENHVVAHQRDTAPRWVEQARDAPDRRRLARSIGPEQAEDLPGLGPETDLLYGDELAVELAEAFDLDHLRL